jgi:hypothetical protein
VKNPALTRYWIELDETSHGYGVTGRSEEDALNLLRSRVFIECEMPAVRRIQANVDLQTLDPDHVLPNAGAPTWRGVWFPNIGPEAR